MSASRSAPPPARSGWTYCTHGPGRDALFCEGSLRDVPVSRQHGRRSPLLARCPWCRRMVGVQQLSAPEAQP